MRYTLEIQKLLLQTQNESLRPRESKLAERSDTHCG